MARYTPAAAEANAPPITQTLGRFVAEHPSRGWSDTVEREAHRTFLNWLGCAIGAARHEAADAALNAIAMLQPTAQASVLGRDERVDIESAALVNGITSHVFDFDDTHLRTVIHPAGPVASAVLALAELRGASGREVIDALVLGIDVSCRIGNAMYPDHYQRGWHITGSTGMLGAAAGCARLLKLDAKRTTMAIGISASQPNGIREQFGSMTKSLHPGAAARTGLTAALLAMHGFTSSGRALEAPRGLVQIISDKRTWSEITDELGTRFEISFNTYKPFACGIVTHPAIDAAVQLRDRGVKPEEIQRIEVNVHPLVLELTGKKDLRVGLEGKFSIYHCVAVGLMFGQAGEPQFSDEIVNRADVTALRTKVQANSDQSIDEDAVRLTALLNDDRRIEIDVEHAIGSLERPLSDAQLDDKFSLLVEPVLGAAKVRTIAAEARRLGELGDVRSLTALCRP